MISEPLLDSKQRCPDRDTLVDFMLGKLPVSELESCEMHLSGCGPCADTIRSLDQSDTMTELARDAFIGQSLSSNNVHAAGPDVSSQSSDDDIAVKDLVGKMCEWALDSKTGLNPPAQTDNDLNDRATEVQHLIDSADGTAGDDGSLGQLAHYRIQRLLGAGSTGVVYLATDVNLNRLVALKVLRPSLGAAARERFLAEARAAAAIDHPNVVSIYHVGIEGKLAYIAMNWCEGETLEQRMSRVGSLPAEQVRELGVQVSQGLSAAHSLGLIHRDIKPANIWMHADSDRYTILDFGLVRTADEDPQLTCTGMIAGTPCYMSPEQSRGAKLDSRSDLFSLGCLLYQSLTGVLPFSSGNVLATLQSIQRDVPTEPCELDPSVPNDLSDLVMSLLEKSPGKRPSSAASVAGALSSDRANWDFKPNYNSAENATLAEREAKPKNASSLKDSGSWIGWVAGLVICGLLGFGVYFSPQIIRIATNKGQLVIKSDDPNIKVEILSNGERVVIMDLLSKQTLEVIAGEYEIRPVSGDNSISIDRGNVTMSRGGKEIVSVTRAAADEAATAPGDLADPTLPSIASGIASDSAGSLFSPSATSTLGPLARSGESSLYVKSALVENASEIFDVNTYQIKSNDVLAVFIENVLGEQFSNPPTHMRKRSSVLPPAVGYPVPVLADGTLSLPANVTIQAKGKTIAEIQKAIRSAYLDGGEAALLKPDARVLATILYRHGHNDAMLTFRLDEPVVGDSNKNASESNIFFPGGNLQLSTSKSDRQMPQVRKNYQIDGGDVLGIQIDGVVGNYDKAPPSHMPKDGSNILPSFGYPVQVYSDGTIALPLVEEINVRGKNLLEIEKEIKTAFLSGDEPILRSNCRIMVSLMQARNPNLNEEFDMVETGDVLGIHIEGIVGEFGAMPKVHLPGPGSDDLPSMGIPFVVLGSGQISLPMVNPISVKGKNLKQVLAAIDKAFKEGDEPILKDDARMFVSLMRKRNGTMQLRQEQKESNRQSESLNDKSQSSSKPGNEAYNYGSDKQLELHERILNLELELMEARKTFGSKHPHIVVLQDRLNLLKEGAKKLANENENTSPLKAPVKTNEKTAPALAPPKTIPEAKNLRSLKPGELYDFHGVCTFENGTQNAGVELHLYERDRRQYTQNFLTKTTSDENGKFTFPALTARDYHHGWTKEYILFARKSGMATIHCSDYIWTNAPTVSESQLQGGSAQRTKDGFKIVMAPCKPKRGKITDEAGKPIAGMKVARYHMHHPVLGLGCVETDSNGEFLMEDFNPNLLQLSHPKFGKYKFVVPESADEISISIPNAVRFTARTINAKTGKPIPNCLTFFQGLQKSFGGSLIQSEYVVQRSDSNGVLDLYLPANPKFMLYGWHDHLLAKASVVKSPKGKNHIDLGEIEFSEPVMVSGELIDEATGKRIETQTSVGWQGPDRPTSNSAIRGIQCNKDGTFELPMMIGKNTFPSVRSAEFKNLIIRHRIKGEQEWGEIAWDLTKRNNSWSVYPGKKILNVTRENEIELQIVARKLPKPESPILP